MIRMNCWWHMDGVCVDDRWLFLLHQRQKKKKNWTRLTPCGPNCLLMARARFASFKLLALAKHRRTAFSSFFQVELLVGTSLVFTDISRGKYYLLQIISSYIKFVRWIKIGYLTCNFKCKCGDRLPVFMKIYTQFCKTSKLLIRLCKKALRFCSWSCNNGPEFRNVSNEITFNNI